MCKRNIFVFKIWPTYNTEFKKVKITKDLSLCLYIFTTGWCKPFIFQTLIFWSYRIHSLKYLRSTMLGCMGIKKSEFDSMLKINKLKAKKRTLTVNLPESSKKLVFLVLDQNFSKFQKNQRISGSRYLYFEKNVKIDLP